MRYGPATAVRPAPCYAMSHAGAQHGGQDGQSRSYVRPTRRPGKLPSGGPGNRPAIRLQLARTIRHIFFLPDAKGAIRGTFVEGRTGRQHEREEGAETVIRFSPLIVFPAGGPGPWFVPGRNIPRRRVSLCSRARGKEESVERLVCPSDSSQRAASLHEPLAALSVLTAFTDRAGPAVFRDWSYALVCTRVS